MEIFAIGEIPQSLLAAAGGKARSLDILTRAGLPVPKGFAIFGMKPDDDPKPAVALWKRKGLGKVAIRSSATLEDGVAFSNAGQFATFLNVQTEEDFRMALKNCLLSAQSQQADAYAKKLLNGAKAQMTVVVQKMVDAKAAGVLFTRNPQGDGAGLIEAVVGLGEKLVSGTSTSDLYHFSEDGKIVGPRDGAIALDEARDLVALSNRAVKAFGSDLDIEWSLDRDGTMYLVQARPITTAALPEIDEFDPKISFADHVLTTDNVGEMLPGAVTPLTITTSALAIDYGMKVMFAKSGVKPDPNDFADYTFIVPISGHLFIDLTSIYAMPKVVYGAEKDAIELSLCGRVLEGTPDSKVPLADSKTRKKNAKNYFRFLLSSRKAKRSLSKLEKAIRFDLGTSQEDLYCQIDKQYGKLGQACSWHYASSSYSGALSSGLLMAMAKRGVDPIRSRAILAGCLSDIPGIESADILKSLTRLGRLIQADDSKASALAPDRLLSYLEHTPNRRVSKAYQAFLTRHGHRAVKEAEMRNKGWADDRLALASFLKAVMLSPSKVEGKTKWKKSRREFLKTQSAWLRPLLSLLVVSARKGVVRREGTKSLFIKVVDDFKKAYRALAVKMTESGLLADPDSIYFLSHKEIATLLATKDQALKKKALARRRVYAAQVLLEFPDVSIGKPKPVQTQSATFENQLRGLPVSKGVVEGKARIVKNPAEAIDLKPGEIMVSPCTDIGYSPYFSTIGGLVTEVGSALSHGAVVAREYSLPLLVDVKGATSAINTGDTLLLDADRGVVKILKRA